MSGLPVPTAGETVNQYIHRLNASGFGPQYPVLGDSYDTAKYYSKLARQFGQTAGFVPVTHETMLRTADPDLLAGAVRSGLFPQGLTPSQRQIYQSRTYQQELSYPEFLEMHRQGQFVNHEISPDQGGLRAGETRIIATDRNGRKYIVVGRYDSWTSTLYPSAN